MGMNSDTSTKMTIEEMAKAVAFLTTVRLYSENRVASSVKADRIKDTIFWNFTVMFDDKPYVFHVSDASLLTIPAQKIAENIRLKVETLAQKESCS